MNPHDREFDRLMREKFENFNPEVPKGLWDKIAATLDANESDINKVVPPAAKKPSTSRWWMSAAAAAFICAFVYWIYRPVEIIQLQGKKAAEQAQAPLTAEPESHKAEIPSDPLNFEPIKSFVAKRVSKADIEQLQTPLEDQQQTEKHKSLSRMEKGEPRMLTVTQSQSIEQEIPAGELVSQPVAVNPPTEYAATVPDIQPLIVLADEEETMLASADNKQPFGMSSILNIVVGTVDQREKKIVKFSNDDEGSIKVDFNFGLAKTRKNKFK